MMKLITFVIPCYNSAEYIGKCIESLLPGGDRIEIILVDDGSTDETASICDEYSERHSELIRTIHQENSGHGGAINTGLRYATGRYFKIVDSDDWVNTDALNQVLTQLEAFQRMEIAPDLLITNYVYEDRLNDTQKPMRYTNVLPQNRVFSWDDMGKFRISQYLLMHSVCYRTQLLRDCGIELPKHTYYVDNLFVYQPLPAVKHIYYLNVDFYRYLIGREGQSINQAVMVRRVDQQIKITKLMIQSRNLGEIKKSQPKLARYMLSYLSMMMTISSLLLIIGGAGKYKTQKKELWLYLRQMNPSVSYRIRYRSLYATTVVPGYFGNALVLLIYHVARKIYHFN
ncbi:MAG: glycosyltransferase family 2 protein [Clostridiales Family XIII bacterium]|jgi:glycosyltransferase involved in cell wall biosynthesis|nr:glycosyltransferase family 2 protein [Clostridiales Family XIII bacterium]